MRIVLAEDDALIADGIVVALKQSGFVVNWVDTGRDACAAMVAYPPDILVLDLGLPDMDGIEVLKLAKRQSPRTQVLILTARESTEAKVRGLVSNCVSLQ